MSYINMKKITTFALTIAAFSFNCFAGEYKYITSQAGAGYTKGDAIASAFMKLPYGATVRGVGVNGISTYKFVKDAGYVQVRGEYTANIIYSK
jgi:hypothetical protein